jgi:hypothetical protein
VLHAELIDGISEEEDLVAEFLVLLENWRLKDGFLGVTWKVKNGVLVCLHSGDVLVKRSKLLCVMS